MFRRCVPLLLAALLCAVPALAIFKYVDDKGHTVFVDREDKIPARYRSQAKPASVARDVQVSRPVEKTPVAPAVRETPIRLYHNLVLLPVELEQGGRRQSLTFLLDTGSSSSVLYERYVQLMTFPHEGAAYGRVVGGGMVVGRKVTIDRLQVGPYEVQNVSASLLADDAGDSPFAGILGNDVLSRLHYAVDFKALVIRWQP